MGIAKFIEIIYKGLYIFLEWMSMRGMERREGEDENKIKEVFLIFFQLFS